MSTDNNPEDKLKDVLDKALSQKPNQTSREIWSHIHEIDAEDVQRIFLILNSMNHLTD